MLFLKKETILAKDGSSHEIVTGACDFWLKKPYGSQDAVTLRNVTAMGGAQRRVANVEGSLKISEYLGKSLKYYFGVDLPVDSYIDVRIGLWGKKAEAMEKRAPAERDSYMFFLNRIEAKSFTRKNGDTGWQLEGSAFDFCQLEKRAGGTATSAEPAHAPHQNSAETAQAAYAPSPDDFAIVADDDDLPF